MTHRLARLALVAGLLTAGLAPAAPASAFACNSAQFPEVCAAYYAACEAGHFCGLFG